MVLFIHENDGYLFHAPMTNAFHQNGQWNQRTNAPPRPDADTDSVMRLEQLTREIAERRDAEALLRESEERARTLVENAPEAIVVFDAETGRFVECNQNACDLYGVPREQLLGRHPAELSPPFQADGRSSYEAAREKIQLALQGQAPIFEWLHRNSAGRNLPCEVRLVRLPGGDRPLVRGSVIDNTERVRREKVQRATYEISEAVHRVEDLDQLYDRIHRIVRGLMPADNFYIALFDPATSLLSFPYHVDAYTPRPVPCPLGTGLTGYVFRFGQPLLVNDAMNARKRYVGEEVTFEGFADIRYRESGVPSAIWLGVPLQIGGKSIGVMAVQDYQDPGAYGETEKQLLSFVAEQIAVAIDRKRVEARLRESEARFSAAFHASPLFLVISRLSDGCFMEVNDALLRWSGYSREQVIGRNSVDLNLWVDPADRARFWTEFRQKGALRDRECILRNRSGAIHTFSVSAQPIEVNREPHVLMVCLDVTQRKQAEQELLRSLAREKELGQLRSNFVSMVSHEFRTPLGVIQSSAEILEDYFHQLQPMERQQHLQSIHKNTRRMAMLMEEVLLFGRFEAGKMDFRPVPIDLAALAGRVIQEVLSSTEQRCPISLQLPDPFPSAAQADERLVRHILTNLLANAVKYSDPGQPVCLCIRSERGDAVLSVRDKGVGIPEPERERLFQAFFRASNVGDRPGTGLGLVIVKRCVDLHRGSIAVESAPGQGTTFTVRLPLFPPS